MKWTTERPTVPGWYWWSEGEPKEDAVLLEIDGDGRLFSGGDSDPWVIGEGIGLWYGPIEPPEVEG